MKRPTLYSSKPSGGMLSGITGLVVTPYTFISEEKIKDLPKQKVMKASKNRYSSK